MKVREVPENIMDDVKSPSYNGRVSCNTIILSNVKDVHWYMWCLKLFLGRYTVDASPEMGICHKPSAISDISTEDVFIFFNLPSSLLSLCSLSLPSPSWRDRYCRTTLQLARPKTSQTARSSLSTRSSHSCMWQCLETPHCVKMNYCISLKTLDIYGLFVCFFILSQ